MYPGIVCLILFDARGNESAYEHYDAIALALAVVLIGLKHVPLHRPHMLEEACEDLIHVATHACCIHLLREPLLHYACALHSTLHLLQERFTKPQILVHSIGVVWLLAAYLCGPRVSEVRTFIGAMVGPYLFDILGHGLVQMCRMAVLWLHDH